MLNRVNQKENVILKQSTTNDETYSQDDDKIFISQKLCDYITSINISTTQ